MLNNFSSIYCFITFVIGAVFMLTIYSIEAIGKSKEPRNNVRFFVKRVISDNYVLYIEGKNRQYPLASARLFENFGLNPNDFADMKEGEIREVFINLEDCVWKF